MDKYFATSDELIGVTLEQDGGPGTALTHWDKRLFDNEILNPTNDGSLLISELTLAALEDTGHYQPRYEAANPFETPARDGHTMSEPCDEWSQTFGRFCTDINQRYCTPERTAKVHVGYMNMYSPYLTNSNGSLIPTGEVEGLPTIALEGK